MNKTIKQLLVLSCLLGLLVLPYFVFAQKTEPLDLLERVGGAGGYADATPTSVSEIVGTIIKAFFGLLGVIFVILMVYAGYQWMTAAGNEERIKRARDTIWRAIVGLIITISAYAIWIFVFEKLLVRSA